MRDAKANNSSDVRRAGRRGFALVEVLIAIFILAIGMISVATVFPVAIHQSRAANDDIVGQMVGKQALALLKAKGLTGVHPGSQGLEADGSVYTKGILVEGLVDPSDQQGRLYFPTDPTTVTSDTAAGPVGFGIPGPATSSIPVIRANEMIWPTASYLPDFNLPVAQRPLAFPEAERFPQYAWKVALMKPDPNGAITALIFVYRVRNWQAYWEGRWDRVFPAFDQILMSEALNLDPGDIVVKGRDERTVHAKAPDSNNIAGIGAVWRIARKRPDMSNPFVLQYGNEFAFVGKLPQGVVTNVIAVDASRRPRLFRMPSGDLGNVRLVAVVSGTLGDAN